MIDIAESVRDNRETRVQAGRGVAKSHTLGCLASWWYDVFPGSAVFLTGTVFRQVQSAFRECRKVRRNANYQLPGRILETGIVSDLDEKWRIVPFAAKNADAALGGHAEFVLVLVDEASGMPPAICETLYGCMSGPEDRILWSGNPLHVAGHFADLARLDHVRNFSVSVKDTINYREGRNVIRGVAGREFVEHVAQTYGVDSDVYRVHVEGLQPREGGNSIFSMAALEAARVRGEDFAARLAAETAKGTKFAPDVAGLDLARLGEDRCALATISASTLSAVEFWSGRTYDYTLDRARAWLNGHPGGKLAVDATSEATFADVLALEFPGRVLGVNFGGSAVLGHRLPKSTIDGPDVPLYANRRAEMWYEAAKWTASTGAWSDLLPDDVALELEKDLLSAVRIDPKPNGSMRVEEKAIARKRIGRSPDVGDAYCLAVAALLGAGSAPLSSRPLPPSGKELAERMASGGVRYSHRYGQRRPVGAIGRPSRRF